MREGFENFELISISIPSRLRMEILAEILKCAHRYYMLVLCTRKSHYVVFRGADAR